MGRPKNPGVWRYEPQTGQSSRLAVPERVGFVALIGNRNLVIAGFKWGLVRLDLRDGATEPVIAPEPERPGNRINDGHVGPDGSLYFGTMDDSETEPTGSFRRWDGQALTRIFGSFPITNGPAVSPDGQTTDPMAGHVFVVETGIRGLPANIFTR